jgi:hypothetical protein
MSIEMPMKMDAIREQLGVSPSYFSALKRKMKLTGSRMGFLSSFAKFIRENPEFRAADVYHSRDCGCEECMRKPVVTGRRRGRPSTAVAAAVGIIN